MNARAAIIDLIEQSLAVNYPDAPVYAAESVSNPTAEQFVVVRWLDAPTVFGRTGASGLDVWVYDVSPDYGVIDAMLSVIVDALTEAVHVAGADGNTLATATYRGSGSDAFDDVYQRVTKSVSFSVVSYPS